MKKIVLLAIGMLFILLPINAQSVSDKKCDEKGFNIISVGYEVLYLEPDFPDLRGVNLQYVHGFRITKKPLFIEVGLNVSYDKKDDLNSLSVRMPINLSYKFRFGKKFAIQPYTGMNVKINPLFQDYQYSERWEFANVEFYKSKRIEYKKIFQFGWQIGLGFKFSKLYWGVQYGIDFMPRATIEKYSCTYDKISKKPIDSRSSFDLKSSHLLVSLGFIF